MPDSKIKNKENFSFAVKKSTLRKGWVKKYFLILLLIELLFSYGPAFAQQNTEFNYAREAGVSKQIEDLLCAPTPVPKNLNNAIDYQGSYFKSSEMQSYAAASNVNQKDLYTCINRLYKFAIAFASVVGVFFIVLGGFVYMAAEGNQEAVDKAKNILTTTIAALVILFSGYILLRAINPDLVVFPNIQPPSVVVPVVPGGPQLPPGGGAGASACVVTQQGGCTAANISQCPAMAQNMNAALMACNLESAGGQVAIASTVDKCTETTTNQVVSFTWGLWQLNIEAGSTGAEFPECSGVLKRAGGPWGTLCINGSTCGRMCTFGPGGAAAFNTCTRALADPAKNTKQACVLYQQRGWAPWPHTRKVCSLP